MIDWDIDITREHFEAYVRVQQSGEYNMLRPEAREATGLSADYYYCIIEHYADLMKKFW